MVCMVSGVLFQGWDVGTLGNTLSGCVIHNPSVGPSEACGIHPTHPVCLVEYTSEPKCCACRLVHKWINEGVESLWANPNPLLVSARVE